MLWSASFTDVEMGSQQPARMGSRGPLKSTEVKLGVVAHACPSLHSIGEAGLSLAAE